MRKISSSISTTRNNLLLFRLTRSNTPKRRLHIKSIFGAKDINNKTGSIIINTDNDQGVDEHDTDYVKRSLSDLEKTIAEDFHGKDLLVLKINQCVINPEKWIKFKIVETYYTGHVLSCLFEISHSTGSLKPVKDSIISKSRKGIEAESHVLQNRLFYNKTSANEARAKESKEYFWIISLEKLDLNRETYLERCKQIRENPGTFDLYKSACGQRVFNLLTDRSAQEYKSPQSASREGVIDILKDDDKVFSADLLNSVIKSGVSTTAYELGKRYLEKLLSYENSAFNSNSGIQNRRT